MSRAAAYLEAHPDLSDSGMFWLMYDETGENVVGVNVNDTERVAELGTALVDPAKPTIIHIHGVQMSSYAWTDPFAAVYDASVKTLKPADYGYSGVTNMNQIWLDRGWNVINYMYHRFADEPMAVNKMTMNKLIEAKAWSTDGETKMRYRLKNGKYSAYYDENGNLTDEQGDLIDEPSYPELEYCVSEYFVGDYLRAFGTMPSLLDNEVRITCHSMGGTVIVASSFLLSELVKKGSIPAKYLPDRLSILDGYVGVPYIEGEGGSTFNKITSNYDCTIRWTGLEVRKPGTSQAYTDCFKQLAVDFDIPIDYYVDANGFVVQVGRAVLEGIKKYCATQYYDLEIKGSLNDHNAIREFYHGSYVWDNPPLDITDPDVTAYALSAKSTAEFIKEHRGYVYYMVDGKSTSKSADQRFTHIIVD